MKNACHITIEKSRLLPLKKTLLKVNWIKDTHRETATLQKTQALTKSINIEIWVIVA